MAQLLIPKGFLLSFFREEARVLGEVQQVTCPHHATTSTLPATKPAPSATASSSGAPLSQYQSSQKQPHYMSQGCFLIG